MRSERGGAVSPAEATAIRRRNVGALVLCAIGSLQMIGYATGSVTLRGIAAATVMSPMPKVFSDVDGLETFASEFTLRYRDRGGLLITTQITAALYGQLGGPYNRRNVYGAALSYAPRLPRPLWEAVFCYGLSPTGPLRRELGIDPAATDVEILIRTGTRGRDDRWTLRSACVP